HEAVDDSRPLLGKPTPCLGRDRELLDMEGLFVECHEESVARAALVTAQPGIGKSRLRHEFTRRLQSRGESFQLLSARGDPLTADTPYGLLSQALRRPFPDLDSPALREARQDPQLLSDRIAQAWIELLRAELSQGTVVLLLEDLHWGDSLSVRTLDIALREL